jgi:hypothetical protein
LGPAGLGTRSRHFDGGPPMVLAKAVRPEVGAAWHRQGVAAQWISVSASGRLTGRRGGGAQDSTLSLRPRSACLRTVWRACPCLVPVSYLSRTCLVPPMWIAIHMGDTRQVRDRYETGTPGRHAVAGPSPSTPGRSQGRGWRYASMAILAQPGQSETPADGPTICRKSPMRIFPAEFEDSAYLPGNLS